MNESPTSGQEISTSGFVPSPFWSDAVNPTAPPLVEPRMPESGSVAYGGVPAPRGGDELAESTQDLAGFPGDPRGDLPEGFDEELSDEVETPDGDAAPGEAEASGGDVAEADPEDPEDAEETGEDGVDGEDEEEEEGADAEADAAAADRNRFAELVEERVRRARYAHHLTRPVFTPGESATAIIVERRAAVWVPTLTFVATLVSAAAAVVLATRLHGDPADPTGHQLLIVMITVCLLAAAFGILLRAEVHYERLRPRGRTVRHDVADAYEIVRDAPRRLVRNDAPLDVLRRISDLLPAAEQLVDALVEYTAEGGSRVREHPAYERIVRMRAEVEALEVMLAERAEKSLQESLGRAPRVSDVRDVGDGAPLPRPEQVVDYNGLADLAATLDPATEV